MYLRHMRLWRLSVVAAIGVPEADARGDPTSHNELTAMRCPMMHTAKRDQIVGVVPAALGTRVDVMKVQKERVATTRDDTLPVIAAKHRSARRW